MLVWSSFGDLWELGHPVTFDGENKLVIVDPSITEINFQTDIYSNWKEWVRLLDNAKWDAALRTTGGDPLTGSQLLGSYFFFINGWRMVVSHGMTIEGNVFSDDFPNPFITLDNVELATNVVSSLTTQVDTGQISQAQELMLLEIYRLLGLDPTRPLVVTQNRRTALPEIDQSITKGAGPIGEEPVTVQREP